MCSFLDFGGSEEKVASADKQLQADAQANYQVLTSNYNLAFREQQQVAKAQTDRLNAIYANPMGLSPQELASQTTSVNENTAAAARHALAVAGAFAGRGGAADVGSGAGAQLAGQALTSLAANKASNLRAIAQENQAVKRQQMWQALSGLNAVGGQFGGMAGQALSGAGQAGNLSIGAGNAEISAQQAANKAAWGTIGGLAGLASAGIGMIPGGAPSIPAVGNLPTSTLPFDPTAIPNLQGGQ